MQGVGRHSAHGDTYHTAVQYSTTRTENTTGTSIILDTRYVCIVRRLVRCPFFIVRLSPICGKRYIPSCAGVDYCSGLAYFHAGIAHQYTGITCQYTVL